MSSSSSSSPPAADGARDESGASSAAKTSEKKATTPTKILPVTTAPRDSGGLSDQGERDGTGGGNASDSAAGESKGLSSLLGAYGSDSDSDSDT